MPVAEALAVEPRLLVLDTDPEEDLNALGRLADWAGRFSPLVGLEDGPCPQCLLLDVTASAHCFGGEQRLLDQAIEDFETEGWVVRVAVAGTVGAAWGLAHHGRSDRNVCPTEAVTALPLAALRLPLDVLHLLGRLGIERVGQLAALPRDALPARFGPSVLVRLDQALGRLAEVIVPHRPQAEAQEHYSFEYPTDRLDAVNGVLDLLTRRLHETLHRRRQGARQVECVLHLDEAAPTRLTVNLSRPSRSPRHIVLLLQTRMEQVRVESPVCAVTVCVTVAEPLTDTQDEFFEPEDRLDEEALGALTDHLSSRLGREAVTRARLVPDPQPEYACRFEPLIQVVSQKSEVGGQKPGFRFLTSDPRPPTSDLTRPLRLWPVPEPIEAVSLLPDGPPIRIEWAGTPYRVVRSWGPERIETGWWRGEDVRRDYYVAATDRGSRLWVFRQRDDERWFLHGSFD
jgi:protein ImuB